MKNIRYCRFLALIFLCSLASCVSVPKEAPQLSEEIGVQLYELEQSHTRMVQLFFQKERQNINEFIQQQWLPVFAENFYKEPAIEAVWQQVVASGNERDRTEFILRTAPEIQLKTQQKHRELLQPLNELEMALLAALQQKYNTISAVNESLTSYLYAAAKVDENRSRYLGKFGLNNLDTDEVLEDTESFTRELLESAETAEEMEANISLYRTKLKEILSKL